MKKVIIVCIIAAFFVACGGSSSLDNAINQVEKAIEKFEKNKGNFTETDWQTLEKEVEKPLETIKNALESGKVGAIQKVKLITLTAKWASVVMEVGFTEIEKQTGIDREDWNEELEKIIKEYKDDFKDIKPEK